jgi:integrase/recombinase XerD
MNTLEGINFFKDHHVSTLKQSTQHSYNYMLSKLQQSFATQPLNAISAEDVSKFLESIAGKSSKSTQRLKYAQVKAFFNYVIDECALDIKNPCAYSLLLKQFRMPKQMLRKILDKELVDELIYKTSSTRDRLIWELQARCGLRVGEVLKLRVADISDRKLIVREPKSGKDAEIAFMLEQIARRIAAYVSSKGMNPDDRLFPVCYSTVRLLIKRLGAQFNVKISPHDFRRHAATYASRNGVPLEIISKVLLRHHDLKTTQVYLGKVTDTEAIRWMDTLHGK